MDNVADEWGVDIGPDGKTVWFELVLSSQASTGPSSSGAGTETVR